MDVYERWLDGLRPVGEGVSDDTVVVLLAGGDKRTQKDDIETALQLAGDL